MEIRTSKFEVPPTYITIIVSFMSHIGALIQFIILFDSLGLPDRWFTQFIILLILSFLFSFLPIIVKKNINYYFTIFIHFSILLIITYPMGKSIHIVITILLFVMYEVVFYIPSLFNLILSLGIIFLLFIIIKEPVMVWNKKIFPPSAYHLFSFIFYSLIYVIGMSVIKHFFILLKDRETVINRQNSSIEQLISANVGFQNYVKKVGEESIINERNRITHDIHDTIGYTLTNIIMMMEDAKDLAVGCPKELIQLIENVQNHARDGLSDIRYVLRALRSLEYKRYDLEAIYKLIKSFNRATGVEVTLEDSNIQWSFGEEIDYILYRIVQEGLTNAFRHGRASKVRINFWQDETGIYINIHDNGLGCEKIVEGIGLMGMKEHIIQLGGRLTANSTTDGFRLFVWIPFTKHGVTK